MVSNLVSGVDSIFLCSPWFKTVLPPVANFSILSLEPSKEKEYLTSKNQFFYLILYNNAKRKNTGATYFQNLEKKYFKMVRTLPIYLLVHLLNFNILVLP